MTADARLLCSRAGCCIWQKRAQRQRVHGSAAAAGAPERAAAACAAWRSGGTAAGTDRLTGMPCFPIGHAMGRLGDTQSVRRPPAAGLPAFDWQPRARSTVAEATQLQQHGEIRLLRLRSAATPANRCSLEL